MEFFDILTPDGKPAGIRKERSLVHKDGDPHGTARIWIVRQSAAGEVELLLQKRAHRKDSFPDCLDASCAGHLSAGQGFMEGALRELHEELGIRAEPSDLHYIGMYHKVVKTSFYGSPFIDDELSAVYIYLKPVDEKSLTLQEEEVSSVQWMGITQCMEQVSHSSPDFCVALDEFQMLEPRARELLQLSGANA